LPPEGGNITSKLIRREAGSSYTKYEDITRYLVLHGNTSEFGTEHLCTVLGDAYVHGWDTPNFHARRRKGELLPQTPFEQFSADGASEGTYDLNFGGGKSIYADGNYSHYTYWMLTPEILKGYAPSPYDMYVQEAAAAIYSEGHDTLSFLYEITDVKDLIFDVCHKLLNPKLIIPRNWRKLSNEWLGYRYGWRPVIYDIKSIYNACQKLNTGKQRYNKTRSHSWDSFNTDEWTTEAGDYFEHHNVQDKISVSVRGSVVADIEVPQFQFNPIQTVWEEIPFSFVVDWFLSVGKSIAAASFLTLQAGFSASCGYRVDIERDYAYSITPKDGTSGDRTQSAHCKAFYEVRTPCKVPLTPHLTFHLNSLKVLDLLGMVVQKLRR
jgi:hypothetical protein